MSKRRDLTTELSELAQRMKELEVRYEQYFAGIEKREPLKEREQLTTRLRRLYLHNVTQTDLRFRINALNSRFQTYVQYWDRILRLIDEGRFRRGKGQQAAAAPEAAKAPPESQVDRLYRQMCQAQQQAGSSEALPSRQQLERFLDKQQKAIRQKFGDRPVEFGVAISGGRAKIVVRTRKPA